MQHIAGAFYHIQERSPQNARNWLKKLYDQLDTLETMPERFGVIQENDAFDVELREMLHFSHRVIFTVDHDRQVVRIVAVRHGAQDAMPGQP